MKMFVYFNLMFCPLLLWLDIQQGVFIGWDSVLAAYTMFGAVVCQFHILYIGQDYILAEG